MYSRSYSKNQPFSVPKQYSGVAFSRPRSGDSVKLRQDSPRPPIGYSPEVGERLYTPGDLPKVSVPLLPVEREETSFVGESPREDGRPRPSFLNSLQSLGDDTLLLIALILILSGCENTGDTVILLILLLVLG